MTQKNFFNTDTATEDRSVEVSDIPWTDTFEDKDNWAGFGTIISGQLAMENVTTQQLATGGWIYGDFDIQVDVDTTLISNPGGWKYQNGFHLRGYDAGFGTENHVYCFAYANTAIDGIEAQVFDNAFGNFTQRLSTIDDYQETKVRIVFVEATQTYTFYGWNRITNGGEWVQLGTPLTWTHQTDNMARHRVELMNGPLVGAENSAYFDNFTINSIGGASEGLSGWTDLFPGGLANAVFYDKFEGGVQPFTSVDIPWTETFTGVNTDEVDPEIWSDSGQGTGYFPAKIKNNKLNFIARQPTSWQQAFITRYKIIGDFDIQMDYDVTNNPTVAGWFLNFQLKSYSRSSVKATLYPTHNGSSFQYGIELFNFAQTPDGDSGGALTNPVGKLRMVRTGILLDCYIDVGAGFVQVYNNYSWEADDIRIFLYVTTDSTTPMDCYADNITINSADGIEWINDYSEAPTENWWGVNGGVYNFTRIINNALTFESTGVSGEQEVTYLRPDINNDFDIQVDWDVTQPTPTTGTHYNRFSVFLDLTTANRVMIAKQTSSTNSDIKLQAKIGDAWQTTYDFPTGITSGKFRLYKIGTLVTGQYDVGGGWVTLGTYDFTNLAISTTRILFENYAADAVVIHDFTNFVINSCDRIVWPGGTLKRWGQEQLPLTEDFHSDYSLNYWDVYGGSTGPEPVITNGELHFTNSSNSTRRSWVKKLVGSFDIQVDVRVVYGTQLASWEHSGIVRTEMYDNTDTIVGRTHIGHRTSASFGTNLQSIMYDESFATYPGSSVAATDPSTLDHTVRIVHDKDTMTWQYYYWNGAWVQMGGDVVYDTTTDYCVVYLLSTATNADHDIYFDNFTVNSADAVEYWIPAHMNRFVESPIVNEFKTFEDDEVEASYWSNYTIANGKYWNGLTPAGGNGQLRYILSGDYSITTRVEANPYATSGWSATWYTRNVGDWMNRDNTVIDYNGGLNTYASEFSGGSNQGNSLGVLQADTFWLRKRRVGTLYYQEYSTDGFVWNNFSTSPASYTHLDNDVEFGMQMTGSPATETKLNYDRLTVEADTIILNGQVGIWDDSILKRNGAGNFEYVGNIE